MGSDDSTGESRGKMLDNIAIDVAALGAVGELVPAICWVSDMHHRMLWMNARGHAFYGDNALEVEKDESLVHPDDMRSILADWTSARAAGIPVERTVRTRGHDGRYRPLLSCAQPILGADGAITGWFGLQADLSADSVRQRHETFLRNLSEATRGMIVTRDILEVTSQMLGRHLGVARVAYSETLPGEYGSYMVEADWTDGTTRSLTGEWHLADVFPRLIEHFATGKTVVVTDVYAHPLISEESAARLDASGIRSAICAPLTKDGTEIAGMMVHQTSARDFSTDEVKLVEDVAERTWATLTRARAEANVVERERHQAFLLEWSDRLRSESDPDVTLKTTLEMLGRHFGVSRTTYAEGDKTGRIFTMVEEWYEGTISIVGGSFSMDEVGAEVERTWLAGEVVCYDDVRSDPRIEDWVAPAYVQSEIEAFVCIPLTQGGKVRYVLSVQHRAPRVWRREEIALMRDLAERLWVMLDRARAQRRLTERERNQAFLLDWSDRIRSETDPEAVLATTLDMVGRHLGVSRVTYTEGNTSGDLFTIVAEWREGEVMSMLGAVFDVNNVGSEVERQWLAGDLVRYDDVAEDPRLEDWAKTNFLGCDIGAMVSTPLLHDGKVRHVLSVQHRDARAWRGSEVALIRDLAERLWVMLDRARAHSLLMERERTQAMLLRWTDSIRGETTPRSILTRTLAAIGEHIGVSRVNYAEADASGEDLLIVDDWVDGAESLAGGRIPIAGLGAAIVAEHLRAVPFRTDDCHVDPRFDAGSIALYDSVDARAFVSIPLVRGSRLVAVLSIQQREPRAWADIEIELLADMAERTWAIIERARSEEQLAESEALLSGYFANSPIAMYLKDDKGRYMRLNQQMARVLGVPIEEAIGHTGYEFVERSAADKIDELDRKALTDGVQSSEIRVPGEDDLTTVLSIRFPIAVGAGPATMLGGFTIDLTEQKRAEAALERSRDALFQSEKLNALGSLLAGVSHELNNPLSIVVAQSVMMERQAQGSDLAERAVKIRKAADRCARIVQTFLGMARQRQPERTATDLDAIAAAAVELAAYGLKTDGIAISVDLAGTLPTIAADADQLHQVLINLIVNAQQAMAEAGSPDRQLTLRTAPGAVMNTVAVDLIDTGPGVPASMRRRIFEPFFTTKPQGEGTGIGLSFSRGLVEAHGGRLELIDSDAGGHFRVTLPVHGGAALDVVSPAVEAGSPPPARRALVVDDEREIAEALADFLSIEGFSCDIAEGGAAAQAKLRSGAYDLVVSDLRMPGVDGPELYAWLLSHRPDLARRTAFATGDTLGQSASRFLAQARRPVLEKPFMPEGVQRLLQEMELL